LQKSSPWRGSLYNFLFRLKRKLIVPPSVKKQAAESVLFTKKQPFSGIMSLPILLPFRPVLTAPAGFGSTAPPPASGALSPASP
jgi:hypothetical protein